MIRAVIAACVLAAAALLALLVQIISDARRPVVVCHKPWLSPHDERAACAIEAALAAHAVGKLRPVRELETKWRKQ